MASERRELVLPRGLWLLLAFGAVGYALYWLRAVLTPVFLAFTIAYILDPVVDRFEAVKVPRPLGIVIVLSVVLGALALFLTLVLPSIAVDLATVASELPRHAQDAFSSLQHWLAQRGVSTPHSIAEWIDRFGGQAEAAAGALVASASGVLGWLIGGTASVLSRVIAWLIVPVFAVYILNDFDRLTAGVDALIPPRYRPAVRSYAREIDLVLSQFLRGQLTVMLALAVLYGTAYSLLGVRLAVPIGIAAGLLNFIPYLGGAFALSAGLLMSLLGGLHPKQLIGVVVAYVLVHVLDGFFITPRVVGKTVGLGEVWVLFALFVGGEAFGFVGVLLAVPIAAVAKIFVLRALDSYRRSALFEPPAPPPSNPPM